MTRALPLALAFALLGALVDATPASAQVDPMPVDAQAGAGGVGAPPSLVPVAPAGGAVGGGGTGVSFQLGGDEEGQFVPALRLALLLMLLALIPSILLSVTSFARIVIVLGFLRQALGTQSLPPNQVIIGLSLFLAIFTMRPVLAEIYQDAVQPYQAGELTDLEALDAAVGPIRQFMARHTRSEDLALFVSMVQDSRPERFEDVDTFVLVPAFMLSELRVAFTMGALIFLPFLVIDLVVASVLMGMGMMMVPPVMVAMPIKLLLFVLADGWNLVVRSLARSVLGV
jgi:flagellar biosynthetic protein FliP